MRETFQFFRSKGACIGEYLCRSCHADGRYACVRAGRWIKRFAGDDFTAPSAFEFRVDEDALNFAGWAVADNGVIDGKSGAEMARRIGLIPCVNAAGIFGNVALAQVKVTSDFSRQTLNGIRCPLFCSRSRRLAQSKDRNQAQSKQRVHGVHFIAAFKPDVWDFATSIQYVRSI